MTQDKEIAQRVSMLRNHGRKDKYLHEKVGFNLRFNEIQAAIGREQLKVLDQLNAGRRRVAGWCFWCRKWAVISSRPITSCRPTR